jgi:hypothetical protein
MNLTILTLCLILNLTFIPNIMHLEVGNQALRFTYYPKVLDKITKHKPNWGP